MRNTNQNKRDKYMGQEYLSANNELMRVIDYKDNAHATVQFVDTGYRLTTSIYRIKNKMVKSPFGNSPIIFDTIEHERVGCTFNINGELVKVIAVNPDGTLRYKILDWYGYEGNTTYGALNAAKCIYNPYRLNKAGCFQGEPRVNRDVNYNSFINHKWHGMIGRCVGLNSLYNSKNPRRPTLDSRLAIIWRNFQNYAEWFDENYTPLDKSIEYNIDKDLLYPFYKDQSQGLKVYSPITCEFLPKDLNIIIGDNKEYKTENIRRKLILSANEYYSKNQISRRAYEAIQYIYNGNRSYNINIDIITPGYNVFLPRLDTAPQFYNDVLVQ